MNEELAVHEGDIAGVDKDGETEASSPIPSPPPLVPQAYRSVFNETVAPPPHGPLARVTRPPVEFPPESKRAQLIEDAEVDLEQDMDELQRAVHDYNVDFQCRLDAVTARGRSLETQIRSEYETMEEAMNQLQHAFTHGFQTAFVSLEQKTLSLFARVEAHDVTTHEHAIRDCEADARQFVYTTVPTIMETLQGTITRKLAKHHETFDIENAKTQKRERKTLAAMAANEQQTLTNFEAERQRRHLKYRDHEEAFHHTMRVDNRVSEAQQSHSIATLVSLETQLKKERRVRQNEDLEVLDKLSTSFHRLQASILENLGEEDKVEAKV